MRANIRSARCQFRLAFELVGDGGVVGHLAGVLGGGFGEHGIEAKWRKSLTGTGYIRSGEQILFGDGEIVFQGALGVEIRGDRCEREGRDDQRFVERNQCLRPEFGEGRMLVILGLRCRVR